VCSVGVIVWSLDAVGGPCVVSAIRFSNRGHKYWLGSFRLCDSGRRIVICIRHRIIWWYTSSFITLEGQTELDFPNQLNNMAITYGKDQEILDTSKYVEVQSWTDPTLSKRYGDIYPPPHGGADIAASLGHSPNIEPLAGDIGLSASSYQVLYLSASPRLVTLHFVFHPSL
jgi:hypothetical protein